MSWAAADVGDPVIWNGIYDSLHKMDCLSRQKRLPRLVCGRCGSTITEPRRHMYLLYGTVWWFCDPECFTEFVKHLCLEPKAA